MLYNCTHRKCPKRETLFQQKAVAWRWEWEKEHIIPTSQSLDKMPNTNNLKEDRFILVHGFNPWPSGSLAGRARWKGMMEKSCSIHDIQDGEREREGQGQSGRWRLQISIHPSRSHSQWPPPSDHATPPNSTVSVLVTFHSWDRMPNSDKLNLFQFTVCRTFNP